MSMGKEALKAWLGDRLDKAVIKNQRDPAIPIGDHRLLLREFEMFSTREYGNAVKASFVVDTSDTCKAGDLVSQMWFIDRQGQVGQYAVGDVVTLVAALLGCDLDTAKAQIPDMLDTAQPGRGIAIRCVATQGKASKKDPSIRYTDLRWLHVDVSEQNIPAARELIDTRYPVQEFTPAPPPPAPVSPVVASVIQAATGGLLGLLRK